MNKTLYAVYNKDEEILYCGTAEEVAKHFRCSQNSLYCNLIRKQKFKWKYDLIKIGKENEN